MNESTVKDDKELEVKTDEVLKELSKKQDSGELNLSVGIKDGKVVLNFGKAVAWISLNAYMAEEVGKRMRKLAKRLVRNGGR